MAKADAMAAAKHHGSGSPRHHHHQQKNQQQQQPAPLRSRPRYFRARAALVAGAVVAGVALLAISSSSSRQATTVTTMGRSRGNNQEVDAASSSSSSAVIGDPSPLASVTAAATERPVRALLGGRVSLGGQDVSEANDEGASQRGDDNEAKRLYGGSEGSAPEGGPTLDESAAEGHATDGGHISTSTSTGNNLICNIHAEKFDICLDLQGFSQDLVRSTAQYFVNAKTRWESVVTGHLPPASALGLDPKYMCNSYPSTIDDVYICGKGSDLDGVGGLLGMAMVAYFRTNSMLPLVGYMEFDNADIRHLGDSFEEVVLHEMGHVMGVGKLFWELKGVVVNDVYIGEAGVREWTQGYGCAGTPPVELDGPEGTKYSHWDEEVMKDELMTGYLNGCDPCPLSKVTVATLEDLGYQVNYAAADPYAPNCIRANGPSPSSLLSPPSKYSGQRAMRRKARLLRAASDHPRDTERLLSEEGLAKARRIGEDWLREASEERINDEHNAKKKGGRGTGKVEYSADMFVDVVFEEGGNLYAVDVFPKKVDLAAMNSGSR